MGRRIAIVTIAIAMILGAAFAFGLGRQSRESLREQREYLDRFVRQLGSVFSAESTGLGIVEISPKLVQATAMLKLPDKDLGLSAGGVSGVERKLTALLEDKGRTLEFGYFEGNLGSHGYNEHLGKRPPETAWALTAPLKILNKSRGRVLLNAMYRRDQFDGFVSLIALDSERAVFVSVVETAKAPPIHAGDNKSLGAFLERYAALFEIQNRLHVLEELEAGIRIQRGEKLKPDVVKSLEEYGAFLSEALRGPRSRESKVVLETGSNVLTATSLASYYVLYQLRIKNDPAEAIAACHDIIWLTHSFRNQAADGLWHLSASGLEGHALQLLATIVAESSPKLDELRLDWIRRVGRTTEQRTDLFAKLLVGGFDLARVSDDDLREFLVMAAHDLEQVTSMSSLPACEERLAASARTPQQRKAVPVVRPILQRLVRSWAVHKAAARGLRGVIKLTVLRLPKEEVLPTIIDPFSGQPARSHPKGFYFVGVNGLDEGGETGDDLLYLTETENSRQ